MGPWNARNRNGQYRPGGPENTGGKMCKGDDGDDGGDGQTSRMTGGMVACHFT